MSNTTKFSIKKKITINFPHNQQLWDFFPREFEIAVVNEPSVFEPLRVYFMWIYQIKPKQIDNLSNKLRQGKLCIKAY